MSETRFKLTAPEQSDLDNFMKDENIGFKPRKAIIAKIESILSESDVQCKRFPECDCDLSAIGVYRRSQVNTKFLESIKATDDMLDAQEKKREERRLSSPPNTDKDNDNK